VDGRSRELPLNGLGFEVWFTEQGLIYLAYDAFNEAYQVIDFTEQVLLDK